MDTRHLFFIICQLCTQIFCTQNNRLEEADFTQCLVHPVVTKESFYDPDPFVPYNVTIKPPPKVEDHVLHNCNCGVHDYVDEAALSKGTSKLPSPLVDGVATDNNQFPFIVALIYRKANQSATHFCGGTLITSKLVLTATHCLVGRKAEKTEVWLNERDLLLSTETDQPTLKIKVKRFRPHPEYNPLMNYNDISILELSEPVDVLKSYLRPICLPNNTSYEPTNYVTSGFTAGWGQTQFNGPKSEHLRHVAVPLVTNKACNEESEPFYLGRVTTHMMCAGDLKRGGPDALGVVSWGERCSEPRKPGVFTRVSKYLRWIGKISAETEQSQECMDEYKSKV